MLGYVYILKLKNGRYYIGSTVGIENRLEEHNKGLTPSTRYLRPVELVFSQEYPTILQARRTEIRLKKYKSRVIIEKIINDGYIRD